MKPSFSDIGIVIRAVDSGEADKYVSIVTKDHGLIELVARGVRRLNSKKSPHLDLLNQVKIQTSRGDHPCYLEQVESLIFYPKIKTNFSKTSLCFTIIEILMATLPVDVEDTEIYLSLNLFLNAVEEAKDQKEINRLGRQFGLFLLRHLGYPSPQNPNTVKLTNYFETIISKKLIGPHLH